MPESDEFCAGQPDAGTLINQTGCRNNYGDPLICDIGGVATLTGVVSASGPACGEEGATGVFADVFEHKEWIQSTIASNP